jgi:integrase
VWNPDSTLFLNRAEMGRVLAVAKERSARDYAFLAICSHTGIRLSECAHLRASDVDNGRLRVTRRKKRVLQPSVIDVSDSLWPLLSEWAASFDGYLFPGSAKPCIIHRMEDGVVVEKEQVCGGGHVHLRTIQRAWALIVAEAGLRKLGRGIHQTRHFFATEMYAATKDLRATQVALSHSTSTMTEVYCHIVDQKEKINKVKAVL